MDREKPARAAFLKRLKLKDERDVEFVRAYESAVVDTLRGVLNALTAGGAAAPARIK